MKVFVLLPDILTGLTREEKCGQKTPLCQTPVSDMLQFAAKLLPVAEQAIPVAYPAPPLPQFTTAVPPQEVTGYVRPQPYGAYAVPCGYPPDGAATPPVPVSAMPVSALEQQLDSVQEMYLYRGQLGERGGYCWQIEGAYADVQPPKVTKVCQPSEQAGQDEAIQPSVAAASLVKNS